MMTGCIIYLDFGQIDEDFATTLIPQMLCQTILFDCGDLNLVEKLQCRLQIHDFTLLAKLFC